MQPGNQVRFRILPDGQEQTAVLRTLEERRMLLETSQPDDLKVNAPIELNAEEAVYLGVVETIEAGRFWLLVEHYLNRKELEQLQAAWGKADD
jgi:hypothetical protein